MSYQPKTGEKCHCKRGQHRDNCPDCEGTGWRIDFNQIRLQNRIYRGEVEATDADGITTMGDLQ